ncbi:hypothetical protein LALCM10_140013 [Dellaglioa algida]|nr:hypothetical protein LALCM10_140013 [Dellaglioa algida]
MKHALSYAKIPHNYNMFYIFYPL